MDTKNSPNPDTHSEAAVAVFASREGIWVVPPTAVLRGAGHIALKLANGDDAVFSGEDWHGITQTQTLGATAFSDFLRDADPETRGEIAFLESRLEAYAGYKSDTEQAVAQKNLLDSGDGGAQGDVYALQDGQHVVKVAHLDYETLSMYYRSEAVSRVPHLVACSLENGYAVMDQMPGNMVYDLGWRDMASISSEHLADALQAIVAINQAGLALDHNSSNLLYDTHIGFSFVDLHTTKHGAGDPVALANEIMGFARTLASSARASDAPQWNRPVTEESLAVDVAVMGRFIDVLERDSSLLEVMRVRQVEINAQAPESRSLIYDTSLLPNNEASDALRRHLSGLGLQGNKS